MLRTPGCSFPIRPSESPNPVYSPDDRTLVKMATTVGRGQSGIQRISKDEYTGKDSQNPREEASSAPSFSRQTPLSSVWGSA